MYSVEISMLPVGQGAMNLIEVYAGYELVNLSLIDCGSEDGKEPSREACEVSVDYVKRKMYENGKGEMMYLNNLFITHRDRDHYNLFDKLFDEYYNNGYVRSDRECYFICNQNEYMSEKYYCDKVSDFYTAEIVYFNNPFEYGVYFTFRRSSMADIYIQYQDTELSVDVYGTVSKDLTIDITYLVTTIYISVERYGKNKCLCKSIIKKGEEEEEIEVEEKDCSLDEWDSYVDECFTLCSSVIDNESFFIIKFQDFVSAFYKNKEEISNLFQGVEHMPPIEYLYIGGNPNQKGQMYMAFEKKARSLSYLNNFEYDQTMCQLLENLRLEVIVRMSVEQLQQVRNQMFYQSFNANNATSAVLLLEDTSNSDFQKCLFMGDATVHTFYYMTECLGEWFMQKISNAVWTAPHHGSFNTSFGIVTKQEEEESIKWDVLARLMEKSKPKEIVVSAGYLNKHGLPNKYFVEKARQFLPEKEEHAICFNSTNNACAVWQSGRIKSALYTTLEVAQYGLPPDGTILQYTNHKYCILPNQGWHYGENYCEFTEKTNYTYCTLETTQAACSNAFAEKIPSKQLFFRR